MLGIKIIKENKVPKNKELNKRIKKWVIISVCNFIILGIGLLFFLLGYLGKIIKVWHYDHYRHISFKNINGFRNWNLPDAVSAHVLIVIGLVYIVLFVLYWFILSLAISIIKINKGNNKKI